MAYPTGSGSETLFRGNIHAVTNATTTFRFADGSIGAAGTSSYTVPALHIITVLTIVLHEQANAANQIHLWTEGGGSSIFLLDYHDIGARETFIWNDKIVLVGGDNLKVALVASGNLDCHISYIDQDWS